MEIRDYYKILEVKEDAPLNEVKKAYRQRALRYHPDRCPDEKKKECEEKFKDIAAAYYVLGDPTRRKEYDDYRKGAYAFRSGPGSGDFASQAGFDFDDLMRHFHDLGAQRQPAGKQGSRYFSFDDLTDIFADVRPTHGDAYAIYRFADAGSSQKVNTDIHAELKITAEVAQSGGEVKFILNDGRSIALKVHPGTKNGQKLRLKGLGKTCSCCDHKGDLIVAVKYS